MTKNIFYFSALTCIAILLELMLAQPVIAITDTCPTVNGLSKSQNLIPGETISMLGSGFTETCQSRCGGPNGATANNTCTFKLVIHLRNNDPSLFPNVPNWDAQTVSISSDKFTFVVPPAPAGTTYDIGLNARNLDEPGGVLIGSFYPVTVAGSTSKPTTVPTAANTPTSAPSPTIINATQSPTIGVSPISPIISLDESTNQPTGFLGLFASIWSNFTNWLSRIL